MNLRTHYNARDVLKYSLDEIWNEQANQPTRPVTVTMDDGDVNLTIAELIYCRYIWRMHIVYPHTPLLIRHTLKDITLDPMTHCELMGRIYKDAFLTYNTYHGGIDVEYLWRIMYEIYGRLYNDSTRLLAHHITSLCILDFAQVMENPHIKAINDEIKNMIDPNAHDIERTKEKLISTMNNSVDLKDNGVALSIRHGMVSTGQVVQCIGPRGSVTDADSYIFPKPILKGWLEGIRSISDSLKVSREATQALLLTKRPMQKAEYQNRSNQLCSATFSTLHHADCGSTHHIPYLITNKSILRDMEGKRYLCDKTNQLESIAPSDTNLIGKVIKLRSVLTCVHPDRYGVCSVCYGDLAYNIPDGTNIGHQAAVELQSMISQIVLSFKHLTVSSIGEKIHIPKELMEFIILSQDGERLKLNNKLKNKEFKLVISALEAPNLHDIAYTNDIRSMSNTRITTLTGVTLLREDLDSNGVVYDEQRIPIKISAANRTASLEYDMLEYIKRVGWSVDQAGDFVIDLSEWDYNKLFAEMPKKQFSTQEYMKGIEAFLKGTLTKGVKTLVDYESSGAVLAAFHDLVSIKLSVNMSHLETILCALLVESVEGLDYNLPKHKPNGKFGRYKQIMFMRSISAFMAYEHQPTAIFSEEAYVIKNRPKHYLDDMLVG